MTLSREQKGDSHGEGRNNGIPGIVHEENENTWLPWEWQEDSLMSLDCGYGSCEKNWTKAHPRKSSLEGQAWIPGDKKQLNIGGSLPGGPQLPCSVLRKGLDGGNEHFSDKKATLGTCALVMTKLG